MINIIRIGRIAFLSLAMALIPSFAFAEKITKDKVTIDYTPLADGTIRVNYAANKSSGKISIVIDGKEAATILANGSAQINKIACKLVKYDSNSSGSTFWRYKAPAIPKVVEEPQQVSEAEVQEQTTVSVVEHKKDERVSPPRTTKGGGYPLVIERLNQDAFFGIEAVANYVQKADSYTKALIQSQNKTQFLIDNEIEKFLNDSRNELRLKKDEISVIAQDFIISSKISDSSSQTTILNSVVELLNNRLNQRETAFSKLQSAVDSIPTETQSERPLKDTIINYSIIGAIVIVLLILVVFAVRKKKNKAKSKQPVASVQAQQDSDANDQAIVVRRKTTSILKKQSIDDVINNPKYMLINTSEFTPDSAVRNIYIKNTCIKEVYNLYAEDLRDSNNPKEDGCMVLGRWVYNEDTHTYDISLETVVFPGDDAVFKEYELNFGGKIKLRIAEKLRKLRRETNLQYDLVCWIHSHPGLGVFFSNSDDNVQMQLKHSQHPNFLIAFVVDILTSDQEMGIFTFRKDGSMNSKGDLTKLYSLEDMYKWTLESDKASFNPDNYHNILGSAKMKIPTCKGIELNNSSIIDLTQIVIEPASGIVGWAVGTTVEVNGGKEFVVSSVVKADEKPTAGVIGVLLNVTHMSIPTIQRFISNENSHPSFVMVYSSRQNILTSIPVINGELITDEHFYGEETIDDLKIWTRRKR